MVVRLSGTTVDLGLAQNFVIMDNQGMTTRVEQIAEQVKALPEHEREEFVSWLSDFELAHSDDWDQEIAQDSQPGGRLGNVLDRVRRDIADGRTKPLDEVIGDS